MPEKRNLRSPEIDIHDKEIAIVGGGPAGAFAAILLKEKGFKHVTIYEPKSSTREKRVVQCTGCAGIIQPEVVELLKRHGLTIPDNVIQARLTNQSQIHLPGNRNLTIRQEKGAVTVYRGFSPINQPDPKTEGFDAWLLREAINRGAVHREVEVNEIDLCRDDKKKVTITTIDKDNREKEPEKIGADIVIGAYGHSALKNKITYPDQAVRLDQPIVSQSAVKEFFVGREAVGKLLNNNMHFFGNPTKKIWFAMIAPKDKFVTVSIMGRDDVDEKDMDEFLKSEPVKNLLGDLPDHSCKCFPYFTTESPRNYTIIDEDGNISQVDIGDAGPTRPMKNGIGAAMDSVEKFVEIINKYGIGREAVHRYKKYIDMTYVWDNFWAKVVLGMSDRVLGNPSLIGKVDTILSHNIPVLTKLANSIIDYIISGKKPYWQIPFMVAKNLLE